MGHIAGDTNGMRIRGMLADAGARAEDLARYDEVISRRRFFGLAGAAAAFAGLGAGADAAMRGLFGRGMIPVAWAQEAGKSPEIEGKPGMDLIVNEPVNGEFAAHLLDDDITPTERHFVRNNGTVPRRAKDRNLEGWSLTVDGEVRNELRLTMEELRALPAVTAAIVIECAGNGRSFFDPPVRGNQWKYGAVGCAEWTGARLRDVLEKAGLKETAVYTAHYGEDAGLGQAEQFSRGIPIAKAMDEHTIIAYRMNGKDLHPLNGYPVRLVVPGWIGSCSQKWMNRIWIRDRVHDSEEMSGYTYRVPAYPVTPGSRPPESDMVIATGLPVKSIITRPAAGSEWKAGEKVAVAGHAWAGEEKIEKVLISTDYGIRWKEARLQSPPNRYAWARWEAVVSFEGKGYYEIWARAFDGKGNAQPFRALWNPKGYLCNVVQRVPVQAKA